MPRKKSQPSGDASFELAMEAFNAASEHYARLTERRDQLIAEINRIDAALAKLRAQFGAGKSNGAKVPKTKAPALQPKKAASGGPRKRGGGPTLRDAIADTLRSKGALSLNDIYDLIAPNRPGVSKKTIAVTLANMRNAGQLQTSGVRRQYKYALSS